jgi:hypothetical protein
MSEINPVFWQPANSVGTAATVDMIFEKVPVKINFYWSLFELSIEPKTSEELIGQIRQMLIEHPLVNRNGMNVFHVERRYSQFGQIPDPGWVPAISL